jgi:transcriptional regulator with XRE-family HTH domain
MPTVRHLQYLRIKKGLTRSQLGNLVDRDYETVKAWEQGKKPLPLKKMDLIKTILGLELEGSFNPIQKIEISDDEYLKYRKFLRMGPIEYTSPTMLFFLGKHFPVKSLAEVHSGIMERKRLRLLTKQS